MTFELRFASFSLLTTKPLLRISRCSRLIRFLINTFLPQKTQWAQKCDVGCAVRTDADYQPVNRWCARRTLLAPTANNHNLCVLCVSVVKKYVLKQTATNRLQHFPDRFLGQR